MAKSEMRTKAYTDKMIAEATGSAESATEDIIQAPKTVPALEHNHTPAQPDQPEPIRHAPALYLI